MHIRYQGQITKSIYDPEIGDIGSPNLVWPANAHVLYDVAVLIEPVMGVRCSGRIFLSSYEQSVLPEDLEEPVPAVFKVVLMRVVFQ